MADRDRLTLWALLREFPLDEVLRSDLVFGLGGAGGAVYLAFAYPAELAGLVGPVAGTVGVIVGLALAAIAVQSAFLDQVFLRKLRAIGKDPVRYLAPLLATTTLGVFAIIATIVLGALPASAPTELRAVVGGLAGWFTFWTLGSLLHNLTTLVQFVQLQADAAEIPDDLPVIQPEQGRRSADASE